MQEALNNALEHGSPSVVRVSLERSDGAARLRVTDDGCGFDPASLQPPADPPAGNPAGFAAASGIQVMRDRALLAGGRFHFETRPGMGTTVSMELPLLMNACSGDAPAP